MTNYYYYYYYYGVTLQNLSIDYTLLHIYAIFSFEYVWHINFHQNHCPETEEPKHP